VTYRQLNRNRRTEASAVVAADGTATVVINVSIGPMWELRQIGIRNSGTVLIPTCTTYRGVNASGEFISQTLNGVADTDPLPNVILRPGESLAAVWTGADVGSICRVTVVYDEVDS
jgi:hypothetical protein